MKRWFTWMFVVLLLVACAKKEIPTGPPPEEAYPPPPSTKVESPTVKPEEVAPPKTPEFTEEALTPEEERAHWALYGRSTPPLKAIFFDFDSYEIRDDMKSRLREDARYLLDHPEFKVELQGNCDERGSSEYNLALGEKRALVVKRYLVNLGIDPERLTTVSFGEEKPLAKGHNEAAWALNRRVDLVITNR